MSWENAGTQLEYRVNGNFLELRVPLNGKTWPSGSGKSEMLGSTFGTRLLETPIGTVRIGANVFQKPKDRVKKTDASAQIAALKAEYEAKIAELESKAVS